MSNVAPPGYVPGGTASRDSAGLLRSTRLFRADLTDYALRRSTWITGLVLLAAAIWIGTNETTDNARRVTAAKAARDLAELIASMTMVFASFFGYLAGAAWMASQHTSGSLGSWLTFHPGRGHVWLSKLLVVTVVPTTFGFIGMCAPLVPLLTHAHLIHPGLAADLAAKLITVATVSSVGFSITSVGRHLLWSLGAVIGYLMASVLGMQLDLGRFMPHLALQHFVGGGARFEGGLIWLTWWALAIGLAFLHFRRTSID